MTSSNTQMILSEALPLLSRDAEKAVFQRLATARREMEALDSLSDKKLHEHSQLWAAKRRVRKFTDLIVKSNLPLVVRVAKRFVCPGINEEMLVSEGLMKLLECIAAFKVELGFKFSTYLQRPLYRHFHRFIQKEQKRNAGRVGDSALRASVAEDRLEHVAELQEVLANNTAGLDALEMTMVLRLYGIGKYDAMTLKGLSRLFGFSTGRIKKTLARATNKLGAILIEESADETK